MYVVTVDFHITPEHAQDFQREMLINARSSVEKEPGCQRFDVTIDAQDPAHFFLFEVYDDEAAFQRHMTMPHFHTVNVATASWIVSKTIAIFFMVS